MTDDVSKKRGDRFFHVLHRVNAVLIFGLAIFALVMLVSSISRSVQYSGGGVLADEGGYLNDGQYEGSEIETVDGQVIAYEASEDLGFRPERGANVSLTNMTTGESTLIAPEGSGVINWQIIRQNGEDGKALGYIAFVADSDQFDAGRFDLVAGTFANLSQATVAQNILYGDLPQVHGDEAAAVIIWKEEDTAEFVSFDLRSGEVIERRAVRLPRVRGNALSLNAPSHTRRVARPLSGSFAPDGLAPREMYN